MADSVICTELVQVAALDNIADYISQDSPENAKKFVQEIFKKVENLSAFPYMGRMVPDQPNEKVREIVYKTYRIIYEIKDDFIDILIVAHGSRILQI